MKHYLVGTVELQDSDGTGRLLLHAHFNDLAKAEEYVQWFANKYYKERPYLCPLTIKEIVVGE